MEKKIKRVPYISKWYKEENNELLHFDFKDEPMTEEIAKELNKCFKNTIAYLNAGSDYDVDKATINWLHKDTTTISSSNNLWKNMYHEPVGPTLKYVCHLTQEELTELSIHLLGIRGMAMDIKAFPKRKDFNAYCDCIAEKAIDVRKYLFNEDNVRNKAQERQLKILEEQAKLRKSYKGTLGEHWKELMSLFEVKNSYGMHYIKMFANNNFPTEVKEAYIDLTRVENSVGMDFIKDFIKACEKCED